MFYLKNIFSEMRDEIIQDTKRMKDIQYNSIYAEEDTEQESEYQSIVKRNEGESCKVKNKRKESLLTIKNLVIVLGILYLPVSVLCIISYAKVQNYINMLMSILLVMWDLIGIIFLIRKNKSLQKIGYLCILLFYISSVLTTTMI